MSDYPRINDRYLYRLKQISDEEVAKIIITDLNEILDHKYGPDFEIKEVEINTPIN